MSRDLPWWVFVTDREVPVWFCYTLSTYVWVLGILSMFFGVCATIAHAGRKSGRDRSTVFHNICGVSGYYDTEGEVVFNRIFPCFAWPAAIPVGLWFGFMYLMKLGWRIPDIRKARAQARKEAEQKAAEEASKDPLERVAQDVREFLLAAGDDPLQASSVHSFRQALIDVDVDPDKLMKDGYESAVVGNRA